LFVVVLLLHPSPLLPKIKKEKKFRIRHPLQFERLSSAQDFYLKTQRIVDIVVVVVAVVAAQVVVVHIFK